MRHLGRGCKPQQQWLRLLHGPCNSPRQRADALRCEPAGCTEPPLLRSYWPFGRWPGSAQPFSTTPLVPSCRACRKLIDTEPFKKETAADLAAACCFIDACRRTTVASLSTILSRCQTASVRLARCSNTCTFDCMRLREPAVSLV